MLNESNPKKALIWLFPEILKCIEDSQDTVRSQAYNLVSTLFANYDYFNKFLEALEPNKQNKIFEIALKINPSKSLADF